MPRTTPKQSTRRPVTPSPVATPDEDASLARVHVRASGRTTDRNTPADVARAEGPVINDRRRTSKLDQVIDLLRRPDGASVSELCSVTGWQAHSIRGAIAGSLKRKGHVVASERIDGVRRYRIEVRP
jgi:hypothetical protein